MKKAITTILIFLSISTTSFAQKLQWFPFKWVNDSKSGKYIDKSASILS